MGCFKRNKQNEITGATVNGSPSILFSTLKQITGSTGRAVKLYNEMRSPEWKEKFGRDWEANTKVNATDSFFVDENGEPRVIPGYGKYFFNTFKGDTIDIKLTDRTDSGFGSELELKVADIAATMIIDRMEQNPEYFKDNNKVNNYFNKTTEHEKGILATDMLLAAFEGVEDKAIAKQLFKIYKQNPKLLKSALPGGVQLTPGLGPIFLNVYDNWNDEVIERTNNVSKFGWRSLIIERLRDYNIILKDTQDQIEEFEDEPIRIYGQSSLMQSPQNTMTDQSKAILSRIKQDVDQDYGYPTYLPVDEVYGIMAELTVGQNSWLNMKHNVQEKAKYNPKLVPIVNKLNNLTTEQEATLFSTFRLTYNNFLLFIASQKKVRDAQGVSTVNETRMINSNQSNSHQKIKQKWRNQSIEENFENIRAPYKRTRDENGNPIDVIKPEKLKKLKTAFNNLDRLNSRQDIQDKHIDALATVIWELGMEYGDTFETTKENLTKYFEKGHTLNIKGKPTLLKGSVLYTDLVHQQHGVMELSRVLQKPDLKIYESNSKTINKLASIAHLFDSKHFGSTINATGKQVWPINMPTPLTDFRDSIQDSEELVKLIEERDNDPFFSPGSDHKYRSIFLQTLINSEKGSNSYKTDFDIKKLDGFKPARESANVSDYDSQSSKTSLLVRLNAFANSGNQKYAYIAIPTQADRGSLDFALMTRLSQLGIDGMDTDTILKGLILQDLARIKQAHTQIENAKKKGDPSALKEGYHYKEGSNPYSKDGSVFTMTQIFGLQDSIIDGIEIMGTKMSDHVNDYIQEEGLPASEQPFRHSPEGMRFQDQLDQKLGDVYTMLDGFKTEVRDTLKKYKINLARDIQIKDKGKQAQEKFIDDFVLNDFVSRIELTKHLRGGYSWAKNSADYYKRMGLINTPGRMLYIQQENSKNPDYGMMPTFKEITIADFNFQNLDYANAVAGRMKFQLHASFLKQGYDEVTANVKSIQISDKYRSVNKTDAQGFISLPMYRGIQMGLGQWDMILDEQAYNNARKTEGNYAGQFVDNTGKSRNIAPMKPYYENLSLGQDNTMTMVMNKNSYMVVTPELAANYPMFKILLDKMNSGVEVINTRTATKGSKQGVVDVQQEGNLDNAKVVVMDSTKLRFPQTIPLTKKNKINFSVQVRKGLISNIKRGLDYNVDGLGSISGQEVFDRYHDLISENIKQDLVELKNQLELNELEKAVTEFGFQSLEHREAKLKHLKQIKGRLKEIIREKGLGKNYERALEIVPNGKYDFEFKIPLAFPNYQAKFEQAVMSMFSKNVIKQSIKGGDFVQIAEIGGYTEEVAADATSFQEELDFYDGINRAQIRIKASALGLPPGTDIKTVDPKLLQLIGYRTPNQGKNSTLPMEVVGFLPESHAKAIMVPGGITVQMGSDFDIDKLSIMLPNYKKVKNEKGETIIERIAPEWKKKTSNMSREMRDNAIMDIYQSIMTSDNHTDEVLTPLDNPLLKKLAAKIRAVTNVDLNINYNNPLAEIKMEERNKLGAALTGVWNNHLAGRNVAETGNMTIHHKYTPSILYNGQEVSFENLGVQRAYDPLTNDFNGEYTDINISLFGSAAVDAAKAPIQIDLNDNIYTAPAAGLMLNVGIPVEDVVYFIAQPSIKKAVEYATNNDLGIDRFSEAIDQIAKEFGKQDYLDKSFNIQKTFPDIMPMDNALLRKDLEADITNEEEGMRQLMYLNNFKRLFFAGRQLQKINKLITPDNIKNINELSSLMEWLEAENRYLRNPDPSVEIILGANELIARSEIGNPALNPIASTFRSVFDSILSATGEMGFINNRDSFHKFKKGVRSAIGAYSLTAAQHKFIDKTLFLDIMTRNNSPLVRSNIISKNTFNALYINKGSNIVSRLINIKKKFPTIANNEFVKNLQPHPSNNNSPYFLIQLDTAYDLSATVKDNLSNGLLDLLKNPEKFVNDKTDANQIKEIKDFAKLLIANQIFTTGFSPGYGGYVDLIHPEIFTDKTLLFENQDLESIVEYFNRESDATFNHNYFVESNEIHNFVRNFGLTKIGGKPFLKAIPYNYIKNQLNSPNYNGAVRLSESAPNVYDNSRATMDISEGFIDYFSVSDPETGESKIFVKSDYNYGMVYQEMQLAGIPSKLNEVGLLNQDANSSIHKGGVINVIPQNKAFALGNITRENKNSESNPEQQPWKACN